MISQPHSGRFIIYDNASTQAIHVHVHNAINWNISIIVMKYLINNIAIFNTAIKRFKLAFQIFQNKL